MDALCFCPCLGQVWQLSVQVSGTGPRVGQVGRGDHLGPDVAGSARRPDRLCGDGDSFFVTRDGEQAVSQGVQDVGPVRVLWWHDPHRCPQVIDGAGLSQGLTELSSVAEQLRGAPGIVGRIDVCECSGDQCHAMTTFAGQHRRLDGFVQHGPSVVPEPTCHVGCLIPQVQDRLQYARLFGVGQ